MVVKEIFNGKFAVYYEKVINRFSSPIYVNRWRKALIRGALTLIKNPKLVVDCCSGAANVGSLLLKEVKGIKLINCDISRELLKMAKGNLKEKAYYVLSDNRFFPLKSSCVDILFSSFCVRNSPEVELTVKEAQRCIRSRGVLAILDFFKLKEKSFCTITNEKLFRSFMGLNKLISEENRKAIDYLFNSIDRFLTVQEFKELLEENGFEVNEIKNFMGGIASTVIATKREV
ncbi:class I SAM-dependent methyltransferase [Thermovibrio sp.]